MIKDRVIDSLGKIDDDMIESLEVLRSGKKKKPILKWGLLTACICVVIALTPAVVRLFHHQDDTHEMKGIEDSEVFQLSGIEYMVCAGWDYEPKHYGLPEEITEEHAGKHTAYLTRGENGKLTETSETTDIELFEYAPEPCAATKILRYGDAWYPVIFMNVISEGGEESELLEFHALYRIFGISSEKDIAAVYVNFAADVDAEGIKITDTDRINSFYEATVSLDVNSADEFEEQIYKDCETQEDIEEKDAAVKEDYRQLVIETKSGRLLYMQLYPNMGFIRRLASHYMIDDLSWLN